MILTAAAWITILLIGGGAALDRVLTNSVEQNFDNQLEYVLTPTTNQCVRASAAVQAVVAGVAR